MADTNPSNFANRPKEEVQAIASMGGKKAHENAEKAKEVAAEAEADKENDSGEPGRRADGKFLPGSEAAKQAGHVGGLHANGKLSEDEPGRTEDGKFKPGSQAAKDAGHKGGVAAAAASN